MSIRIHKVLGYGMDAFKPTPQFEERCNEWRYTAFLDFAEEHFLDVCKIASESRSVTKGGVQAFYLDIRLPRAMKYTKVLHRIVAWDNEGSSKRKIVLIPPAMSQQWYRFDDAIDYAEARSMRSRFVKLDRGIYPYDKGNPPLILAAMCLYLGVPELFAQLEEVVYTYWC